MGRSRASGSPLAKTGEDEHHSSALGKKYRISSGQKAVSRMFFLSFFPADWLTRIRDNLCGILWHPHGTQDQPLRVNIGWVVADAVAWGLWVSGYFDILTRECLVGVGWGRSDSLLMMRTLYWCCISHVSVICMTWCYGGGGGGVGWVGLAWGGLGRGAVTSRFVKAPLLVSWLALPYTGAPLLTSWLALPHTDARLL